MRKFTTLSFLFLFCVQIAFTQSYFNRNGHFDVAIGIGLMPTYSGKVEKTIVPPVSARLNYWLTDFISVGGGLGYYSVITSKRGFGKGAYSQWKEDMFAVGLRGAAHLSCDRQWDFYGGLLVNYYIPTLEREIHTPEPIELSIAEEPLFGGGAPHRAYAFACFMGGSYAVSEVVKVWGELSFGISVLSFGTTIQL